MRPHANGGYGQQNSTPSRIRALAETQSSQIRRDQLHEIGLSDNAIAQLVRRQFLVKTPYRGVYGVGVLPQLPLARAHGALLSLGEGSALSHDSAGTYWGVYTSWRTPLEVVSPIHHNPTNVTVHHCVTLIAADVYTDADTGVRVTSAARTTLDLTPRLGDDRVSRTINRLRLSHDVTRSELHDVIERNLRHRGARRLLKALLGSQRNPTRSELEQAFLRIVRRYGLPMPQVNEYHADNRVDFYFPEFNLIVEVDGPLTHKEDPAQWSEDRRRDREIFIAEGSTTIRFTYDDCYDTPAMVADTVRRVMARIGG